MCSLVSQAELISSLTSILMLSFDCIHTYIHTYIGVCNDFSDEDGQGGLKKTVANGKMN